MLYFIIILVSFIASLTNYLDKSSPLYLKIFPVLILVVLVGEYIGLQMARKHQTNVFLYNIIGAIEFTFYLFFYHSIYRASQARKIMLILIMVYWVAALINIFFIQGINVFNTYTYMVGCLFVILASSYYFLEMFRYPQSGSIMREPAFWITSALLFYYTCVLPVFGILNYISSISRYWNHVLRFIINLTNILLYSLFTLAFLCKLSFRKKYTS
jgi:hypothetical protein